VTSERSQPAAAYTALATSGILWGSSFVLGKIALTGLGVSHMILYRFLIASICFLPLLVRARPRVSRADWGLILFAGAIGVSVQFLVQFEGLSRTSASHAALMIGTAPVLVAVSAYFVFHERLHRSTWFALCASTLGVVLIVLRNGHDSAAGGSSLGGDLLVLASMFAAVVWILVSKRLMTRHSPVVVSGLITTVGTVILTAWVLWRNGPPPVQLSASVWLAIAGLGFVCTVCTTILWNWGLSHVAAGKAGAFINLEPVIGAILGVWLLHERLGLLAVAGGAVILASAIVVSLHDS
jgi:drug/metabolite transporter (DMT)-like permease